MRTILIVDDNERIRQLLRHFFLSDPEGFAVQEAGDGLEAVERVEQVKPDLIVLDLSMPRLNGLDAARKIRAMLIRTPIILFTMYSQDVPATVLSALGVNAVVTKPDLTALHRQVDHLLH